MRLVCIGVFFVVLTNCSTFMNRPETRVSPICAFGNEKIKNLDFFLNEPKKYPKNSKLERLYGKIKEYENLRKEMLSLNITSDEISKTLVSLQDRMDAIRLTLSTREEKEGDLYAGQYNFPKAIESYSEALHHLEFIDEKNKIANGTIDRIQKKISITKENAENFLNNRIKSLIDQAIYLNLDDQTSKAKEAMKQAEKELESSIFTNPKIVSLYSEQAKVMNLYDKEIESTCTSKSSSEIRERMINTFPETFKTKSGIAFTKVIRKDGVPVYVSERIRPYKSDSWYFARDYAEKLNREENCPDCYQLPEFGDIENLKPREVLNKPGDKEVEDLGGTWLKSWSPNWARMIWGNILYGIYTFDYLHDVVSHPITWQSYLYPISPDCVFDSRRGYWDKDFHPFRSAERLYGSSNRGFRLVRPLR